MPIETLVLDPSTSSPVKAPPHSLEAGAGCCDALCHAVLCLYSGWGQDGGGMLKMRMGGGGLEHGWSQCEAVCVTVLPGSCDEGAGFVP